ncbi:MAG: ATP-dependent RecD-like DNA helicase [Gammaproteobacteria bacterium]
MTSHLDQQLEHCHGTVERIVFHNPDNGFCVLRAKIIGHKDLVTITAKTTMLHVGESIHCQGHWQHDKKHGLQFKAVEFSSQLPANIVGIEKYLASGMIKGVGPHFAKVLIKAFGEKVFDIIEHQPEQLAQLPGIGAMRQQQISQAWAEQKSVRDIMVFLQSYGIGTARAVRIYKTYGDAAIKVIQSDPYCLARDIRGIGFKTADELARQLGIAVDSIIRARAGCYHVLQEFSSKGHCAAQYQHLVTTAAELLAIPSTIIQQALAEEIGAARLIQDTIAEQPVVFLAPLYQAEVNIAQQLTRLLNTQPTNLDIDVNKAVAWVEKSTKLQLSASQQQAVKTVLNAKVSIITGGPGVGKTTIVNSILTILSQKYLSIVLCAPTGRAAKRLTETTNKEAKTIHRLLGRSSINHFQHDQENPLAGDFFVVDESSMIDVVLMQHLLKAIPTKARLLLVGDVDQLPSVGAGNVLADLIKSQAIPTVRLTEIFRQAQHSKIITNAHRINQGEMPAITANSDVLTDFYFIPAETPEHILEKLMAVVTQRIPQRFKLDPCRDIQVLSPMNRSILGVGHLNHLLQQALNPIQQPRIQRFGWTFAPGDKVIQTSNNYDKDVFNGDIGFIQTIDETEQQIGIEFDGRKVWYNYNELDELALAYATTIHKSQGSEYPAVVIPLATQHFTLLERNLLYTAVTRGKQLVVLIGQQKAIAIAVKNKRAQQRVTHLADRVRAALSKHIT